MEACIEFDVTSRSLKPISHHTRRQMYGVLLFNMNRIFAWLADSNSTLWITRVTEIKFQAWLGYISPQRFVDFALASYALVVLVVSPSAFIGAICSWLSLVSYTLTISVFFMIPPLRRLCREARDLGSSRFAGWLDSPWEASAELDGAWTLKNFRREDRDPDMRPRLNSISIQIRDVDAESVGSA